jgi:hypothetical protein
MLQRTKGGLPVLDPGWQQAANRTQCWRPTRFTGRQRFSEHAPRRWARRGAGRDQVPKTWNSHRLYPYPVPRTVPYIRM